MTSPSDESLDQLLVDFERALTRRVPEAPVASVPLGAGFEGFMTPQEGGSSATQSPTVAAIVAEPYPVAIIEEEIEPVVRSLDIPEFTAFDVSASGGVSPLPGYPPMNSFAFDNCCIVSLAFRLSKQATYPETLLHLPSSPGGIAWTRADFESKLQAAGMHGAELERLWELFCPPTKMGDPFRVGLLGYADFETAWLKIKGESHFEEPATFTELENFSRAYFPGGPSPAVWLGDAVSISRSEFFTRAPLQLWESELCPLRRLRNCVAATRLSAPADFQGWARSEWRNEELRQVLGFNKEAGDALFQLLTGGKVAASSVPGGLVALWAASALPGQVLVAGYILQEMEPTRRLLDRKFDSSDAAGILAEFRLCSLKDSGTLSIKQVTGILKSLFSWKGRKRIGAGEAATALFAVVNRYKDILRLFNTRPSVTLVSGARNPLGLGNDEISDWRHLRDFTSLIGLLSIDQTKFAKRQLLEIDHVLKEEDGLGLIAVIEKELLNGENVFQVNDILERVIVRQLGFEYSPEELFVINRYLDPESQGTCEIESLSAVIFGGLQIEPPEDNNKQPTGQDQSQPASSEQQEKPSAKSAISDSLVNRSVSVSPVKQIGSGPSAGPSAGVPAKSAESGESPLRKKSPKKTASPEKGWWDRLKEKITVPDADVVQMRNSALFGNQTDDADEKKPAKLVKVGDIVNKNPKIATLGIPIASRVLLALLERHRRISPNEDCLFNLVVGTAEFNQGEQPGLVRAENFRRGLVCLGFYTERSFAEEKTRMEFDSLAKLLSGGPGLVDLNAWRRCVRWAYLDEFIRDKFPPLDEHTEQAEGDIDHSRLSEYDRKTSFSMLGKLTESPRGSSVVSAEVKPVQTVKTRSLADVLVTPAHSLGTASGVASALGGAENPKAEKACQELLDRLTGADPWLAADGTTPPDLHLRVAQCLRIRLGRQSVERDIKRILDRVFNLFDQDGSGRLEFREMRGLLNGLGYPGPIDDEALGRAFGGELTREEFVRKFCGVGMAAADWLGGGGVLRSGFPEEVEKAFKVGQGKYNITNKEKPSVFMCIPPKEKEALAEYETRIRCGIFGTGSLPVENAQLRFSKDFESGLSEYATWLASQPRGDLRASVLPTQVKPDENSPALFFRPTYDETGVFLSDPIFKDLLKARVPMIRSAEQEREQIVLGCCPGSPLPKALKQQTPHQAANRAGRDDRKALATELMGDNAALQRAEAERMAQFLFLEATGVPEPASGVLSRFIRAGWYSNSDGWMGVVWDAKMSLTQTGSWKFDDSETLQTLFTIVPKLSRSRSDVKFVVEFIVEVEDIKYAQPGYPSYAAFQESVSVPTKEICVAAMKMALPDFFALTGDRDILLTLPDGSPIAPGAVRRGSIFESVKRVFAKPSDGRARLSIKISRPPTANVLEGTLFGQIFALQPVDLLPMLNKARVALVRDPCSEIRELTAKLSRLLASRAGRQLLVSQAAGISKKSLADYSMEALLVAARRAVALQSIVKRNRYIQAGGDVDINKTYGKAQSGEDKNLQWLRENGFFDPNTQFAYTPLPPRLNLSRIAIPN